jgi:hypothetical protein
MRGRERIREIFLLSKIFARFAKPAAHLLPNDLGHSFGNKQCGWTPHPINVRDIANLKRFVLGKYPIQEGKTQNKYRDRKYLNKYAYTYYSGIGGDNSTQLIKISSSKFVQAGWKKNNDKRYKNDNDKS